MRDIELYRHVLGLETPWTVARVDLSVKDQRVDVWAERAEGQPWPCPECGTALRLYDHAEARAWRHLDTCQFMTVLHARPPRVQCPTHGVRQVTLPWAEVRARFTALFERFAIDVLKETDIRGATRILLLSLGRSLAHPGAGGGAWPPRQTGGCAGSARRRRESRGQRPPVPDHRL